MKKINSITKQMAINLLTEGRSAKSIAKELGISLGSVSNIRAENLPNIERSVGGRPRILSDSDKRLMGQMMLSGECKTGKQVFRYWRGRGKNISHRSILNNLAEIGFKAKKKVKKPHLTQAQKTACFKWAKSHINWTINDWKRVIFSDETKINLWNSDGIKYYWARDGDKLLPFHLQPTVKHGGGSLMFWGCMTWKGLGYGCRIYDGSMKKEDYIEILNTTFKDTLEHYGYVPGSYIFQHDNDPKHTAKATTTYLKDQNIEVLPWPSQSADLNPIEHVWNYLKVQIGKRDRWPTSIHDLWEVILEEWEKIPLDFITTLIESMPARVKAVLNAKGGQTKY